MNNTWVVYQGYDKMLLGLSFWLICNTRLVVCGVLSNAACYATLKLQTKIGQAYE